MCPKYHCFCSRLPLYLLQIPLYLLLIPLYLPQIPLYLPQIPLHFFLKNTIGQKNTAICDNVPLYFKIFVWQCESRAQRTKVKSNCGGRASSPSLPQCQLGDCQVHLASQARLGVLGNLLVDIGLKLHSVHFVVKFSSALDAPPLRRTGLQSAPLAVSTQVRLSPISSRPRLAALDSADLKMDLAGLEPESVKSHSAT